jgi:hypothetical protein
MLRAHDIRRVAVSAMVDPRTVRAYLRGRRTQSTTAARIAEALRTLGIPAASPDSAKPAERTTD